MMCSFVQFSRFIVCGLMCVALLTDSPTFAQDTDLPKAEDVLNRFIKETGGMAAHQKIKSRKQTGVVTIQVAGQEIEMDMRSISQVPNKSKVDIDLPTGSTSTRVFDGEHLWEVGGPTGDVLHDEKTTSQTKENSNFHGAIDWKNNYQKVETVGIEKVDDKDAIKIKCTTQGDRNYFHWFDKESGLMVKTLSNMELPGLGPVEVQIYHSDYQTVDGIKLSMTSKQVIDDVPNVGSLTQIFKVTKTEQNVDVPKDAFAMPDSIKEMMDK